MRRRVTLLLTRIQTILQTVNNVMNVGIDPVHVVPTCIVILVRCAGIYTYSESYNVNSAKKTTSEMPKPCLALNIPS